MELRGWQIMLMSIENFFLLNTLLSVAAFAVVYILQRNSLKLLNSWHPIRRARLYILALAIPPALSAWLVCASLFPAMWLGRNMWEQEHVEEHSLHLFNAFTSIADPMLGYTAITFTLITLLIAIWAAWGAYFRINRLVECLEIGATPTHPDRIVEIETTCSRYGIEVGLVVSNYPFSFVWGYIRAKLIVSTGLLNALSREELIAVLEHEIAHHARRDNLLKWVLTICRYATPVFPLTTWLYNQLNEQIEMICDEVAIRQSVSSVDLAGALVQLKRLTLSVNSRMPRLSGSGFLDDGRDSFERRVTRALSLEDEPFKVNTESLSGSCVKTIFAVATTFTLSLGVLFLISPLAIHRMVELLLQALHI